MTKKKRPSGLAAELNETAEGMHRIGLLDRAAHDKITLRHLGRNGASKVATITLAQAMRASARMHHARACPIQCATLTTAQIQNWLRDLANSPARLRTKASAKKPNVRSLDKNDPEAVRRRRASANRTLVILKAALNSAWRAGKIHSDQAWQRVTPFEEADAARVRYLAIAEAKRLVDSSAPDFRQLVQAALVTGARYGELASLRASDLNTDSGTVHVRTSKSGTGRHVVLSDEGVAVFKSFVAGKSSETRLLIRSDGTAWTKSLQARPMAEACKDPKIEPEISFHVLRHTWASLAVMAGVPLLVVARNLGHADTRMVEKHYGHLAPSYIVDAIRASGPRFGIETDGIH